jgi:hypothetical protein
MKPWLIQRGTFKKIPDQEIVGLDSLISYDYMGSSEFEWGALPQSLTAICQKWQSYKVNRMDEIQDLNGNYLYFLSPEIFEEVSWHEGKSTIEDLKGIIKNLFTKRDSYQLKERSNCYEHIHGDVFSGRIPETNFWWDVNYHWMMCFGKDIKRLILAIQKVCEKKSLPYDGGPTVGDDIFSIPIFGMDALKNKITITDLNGRATIISLGNVKSVIESPERVIVGVRTRSGTDKDLDISIQPCAKRDFFVKLLQDCIELNQRKNFHV